MRLPGGEGLGRFFFGNVAEHRHSAGQLRSRVIQRLHAHAQHLVVNTGPAQHHFELVDALAAQCLHQRALVQRVRRFTVRQQQLVRQPPFRQPDAGMQRRAVKIDSAGVDAQKTALGVDGDNAVAHAVEDLVEQRALLVGVAQGVVKRAALRLQRLGQAVESHADLPHLVQLTAAEPDAGLQIAAGELLRRLQYRPGRVDDQALSQNRGHCNGQTDEAQQCGQIA